MAIKKKEVITVKLIEQDIINSLKKPQEMSESIYQKLTIPCIIIGCLLTVILFLFPKIGLYIFLAIAIVAVVSGVVRWCLLCYKRKTVCIDDYEIITDVLSNTVEETYTQKSRRHSKQVNNYTLHFEHSGNWRIPNDNYVWSEESRMSDYFVYQNAHRGKAFYVVVEKSTGNIAMTYHTKFFEYKKS